MRDELVQGVLLSAFLQLVCVLVLLPISDSGKHMLGVVPCVASALGVLGIYLDGKGRHITASALRVAGFVSVAGLSALLVWW